ncbi:MAG: TRAP transporter small permease [Deltaproteobacteria bacterium]|nr:TRAP transporter small permease [Deltaproteobacteria bacterium]MBW1963328.1 TRAP transporter small permease [Deltaproteobacteria bacterium]MBW1995527.1 TRAP transporter small permease [Deltaproteobacteria bacterium]MBW2154847.1 TRAP transporter small permease [Deltaproteobacteria bacterium]
MFEKVSKWCARITVVLVVGLSIALVLCILISIFFRYVVEYALSWPEELSMLLFAWLVILGGSLGVREGFHVRLTVIIDRFPRRIRYGLNRIITVVITLFGVVLVYAGQDLVTRTAGHLSATIEYPIVLLYYPVPVCGVLIIIHGVSHLFKPVKEGLLR